MHVILGATGHIGSALADELLERAERIIVVSRNPRKAEPWKARGAEVAIVDVHDVDALRRVFQRGKRLFLLNPPADPSSDTSAVERASLRAILAALEGSGIRKIVAESTYGAQPGTQIGDLGVLYEMEQALGASPIPATIVRGAFYMSNWDSSFETARTEGRLYTFYPLDFELPMVAPDDIGRFAATLMLEPENETGLFPIEGPSRYTPRDVARAVATAFDRDVEPVAIPPERWTATMTELGFSPEAAASYAGMFEVTLQARAPDPETVTRGPTTLAQYIERAAR